MISGASGFVGAPLCSYFSSQGHEIVRLVRAKPQSPDEIQWDPVAGKAVKEVFEGFNAVIHLEGEPLTLSRWGSEKKKKILFSRTVSTWLLSHILSSLHDPPQVFISASAFGFYGDRGEEQLDEESPAGTGFLANVCCEWEKAGLSLQNRGTRTVKTRFGLVIGPKGGIVQKMRLPYSLGLGPILGSGNQWISWIALKDLIRAMDHVLHSDLEGAVNFVSPHPVRQRDFSQTFARLLSRPTFLKIPASILHLALGQAADDLLLASARVNPKKLIDSGFTFKYPDLSDALKKAL